MGHDTYSVPIYIRVERHNVEQDRLDDEAVENLIMEIRALIASTPEYERVADL